MTRLRNVMPAVLLFGAAGIFHFVGYRFFERIVPPWVPNAPLAVQISGVAELAGAIGLLWPKTRRAAAWGLIALLAAVFPANVQMVWMARASGASAWLIAGLWARLPIQPLIMWWMYRAVIQKKTTNR